MRLGATLCLLGAVVLVVGTLRPARAVDRIEVGSWWRAQPDGGGVPAPPQVPEGGLWVSSDPSGPSAVSALRFRLGSTQSLPLLTLKVDNSVNPLDAPVWACAATSDWQPATAGEWSAKPSWDCSVAAIEGTPSLDGSQVLFDLSDLGRHTGDTVSAVFLVREVANPLASTGLPTPGTVSPAVDVTFEAPTETAFSVHTETPPATSDDSASAAGTAPSPAPVPVDSVPATNPEAAAPLVANEPVAPSAPVPGPRPATVPSQAAAPLPPHVFPVSHTRSDEIRDRLIAAFVLLDLAVWWYRLSFRKDDAGDRRPRITLYDDPRLVLAMQPARVTTPRSGHPPALR